LDKKTGFVAIIGKPNVGKSTLINQFVGEKIAIITDKPQTTRTKIQGIYNDEETQIVFLDTPGIHRPKSKLGEIMVKSALSALNEVELVLMVLDAKDGITSTDMAIIEKIKDIQTPIVLVINKMDSITPDEFKIFLQKVEEIKFYDEFVAISAMEGKNLDKLIDLIKTYLKFGPLYYPEDMLSDMPESEQIAEIIREKLLLYLDKEIPHGVNVQIEKLGIRNDKEILDIEAIIVAEKKSHKGIIIGKEGRKLKGIGKSAREEIEKIFDVKVNLQLWVKVKEGWRNDNYLLKSYGFKE
jgi:GTP-binding protein Era